MGLMQLGGAGAAPGMMQPPQQQQHTSPPPPHHQQPNHFTHMLATQNPNKLPQQQEHSHAVNSQVLKFNSTCGKWNDNHNKKKPCCWHDGNRIMMEY